MIYSLLQSSACLFLTAVGFLCTRLSVFFSCSFNFPDWTPFLMRNIYCSPIPSVCDLFAPHFLKLSSLQLLSFLPLFLIVSFSLLFFLFLPFLFHLLSNNHPSPSSLTSLSPTASASCISHPCLILLFWHLCWFVLLMCYHFCATLAFLLGPSAPVAEENIA